MTRSDTLAREIAGNAESSSKKNKNQGHNLIKEILENLEI